MALVSPSAVGVSDWTLSRTTRIYACIFVRRRGDIQASLHISASSTASHETTLNNFLPALQKAEQELQIVLP